ncbi:MAG: hypothetical protein AAGN66_13325 [Acidobacteriota bacterium]
MPGALGASIQHVPQLERRAAAPPPQRPPRYEEALAHRLFLALSPSLRGGGRAAPAPPPFENFRLPRAHGRGELEATWFPAVGEARGAVLLAHPWTRWGRAYFHRRGRLLALRRAGYHAMTFDFGGLGSGGPVPEGFFDLDVEDAFRALAARAPGLPLHVWGVSGGGYWAHPFLTRTDRCSGAFFEDVAIHLIEWSKRQAPAGMPFYLFFQRVLRRAHRFLDLRSHAPHLRVRNVAYAAGGADRGIPVRETAELASLAGGPCLIVPEADHLEALRRDAPGVIDLALATFRGAEG